MKTLRGNSEFKIRNSEFGIKRRGSERRNAPRKALLAKAAALVVLVALSAALLAGCVSINFSPTVGSGVAGRGTPETYTWTVGDFSEIRVEMHANIEYYAAPSDTVTLEIQPNLREYIEVSVSGSVLTVRSTRDITVTGGRSPVLTVSTPELKSLSLAGAGVFTAHDTIVTDSLTLRLDGAGSGRADVDVDNLTVHMAGAGSFDLSGRADAANINMAGAGAIEALDLQTLDASVNLAGVGTVRISCSDSLHVVAGGVGTVEYRGSPALDVSRGGLVTVRQVD
jgi:hypothetical protein